jgi:hypothetical protein
MDFRKIASNASKLKKNLKLQSKSAGLLASGLNASVLLLVIVIINS